MPEIPEGVYDADHPKLLVDVSHPGLITGEPGASRSGVPHTVLVPADAEGEVPSTRELSANLAARTQSSTGESAVAPSE